MAENSKKKKKGSAKSSKSGQSKKASAREREKEKRKNHSLYCGNFCPFDHGSRALCRAEGGKGR